MVDEKSRVLARPNEDHRILTGQTGQTVQQSADSNMVLVANG